MDPWGTEEEEEEEYCRDPYETSKCSLQFRMEASRYAECWTPPWESARERHSVSGNRNRMQSSQTARCHLTIGRAISQYGEMTIYQRSSILKSAWNELRQQQRQDVLESKEPRETAGKTESEAPCLDRCCERRVLVSSRSSSSWSITRRQHLVDKLQDGYRDKFIIKDLQQEGVSNVFSEDSKKAQATRAGQHRAVRT